MAATRSLLGCVVVCAVAACAPGQDPRDARIERLEQQVARQRAEIARLRARRVDEGTAVELPAGVPSATPSIATSPSSAPEAPPLGPWEHVVADGARRRIVFRDDGSIEGARSSATWSRAGSTLILRWKDVQAPGGEWVDTCTLDSTWTTYAGINQQGVRVRGRHLAPATAR